MARNKVATTVYLEPEQLRQLKALSKRTEIPVAAYIRKGIDLVLESNAHLLPGQLTLFVGEDEPIPETARPHKELSLKGRLVHKSADDGDG